MFIEARPVTGYGETVGWKVPSSPKPPKPASSHKANAKQQLRPPLVSANSSTSSLSAAGFEQSVPSFKGFVARTPKVDKQKALPPLPAYTPPRRSWTPASSTSVSDSAESPARPRRTSSIYSRTVSQWIPDPSSPPPVPQWNISDFADDSNLLLLRPIAYSASTPHLVETEKLPAPPLLEPRTYSPLINTPSPTASGVSSRLSSPEPEQRYPIGPRPSILLPPPPPSANIPKKHLRTVSIEKAKAAYQAPGAVHLLPEELRARTPLQTLRKSRSHEGVVLKSPTLVHYGDTPPQLPSPPVLRDSYGRERIASLTSPITPLDRGFAFPYPVVEETPEPPDSARSFAVGSEAPKTMVPIAAQPRKASRAKAAQALGLDAADEPRGRTRQRGPRKMSYDHYLPQRKSYQSSSSSENGDIHHDAQKTAKDYHALLTEQYRSSPNSSTQRSESDHDIRQHMKMVPQPLFHSRPVTKQSKFGMSTSSFSSFHTSGDSGAESVGAYSNMSAGPLKLSLADSFYKHERQSTSGSIPISPPTISAPLQKPSISITPFSPLYETQAGPQHFPRRHSDDNHANTSYPQPMHRYPNKSSSSLPKKKRYDRSDSAVDIPSFPRPLLAADIIAQRLQTPNHSPSNSPSSTAHSHTSHRTDPTDINYQSNHKRTHKPRLSTGNSNNNNKNNQLPPLHIRLAQKTVRYADLLTRPRGYEPSTPWEHKASFGFTQHYPQTQNPEPRASSPHLLPSPSSLTSSPKASAFSPDSSATPGSAGVGKLGWGGGVRSRYESLKGLGYGHLGVGKGGSGQGVVFSAAPARLLDESRAGLVGGEGEGVGDRYHRPSVLVHLMEGKRESRAQKRREDLKRMIRVVPEGGIDGGSGGGGVI